MRKPIPESVRKAVLGRANGCCEVCGRLAALELHHLTYTRDLAWWDGEQERSILGYEQPEDLKALCRECHHAEHIDLAGDFWGDPDEMRAYWQRRQD
jgi:5-methylcytosine-specific restriction endonuclease McrA